jgi:hypothetical protein
MRVRRDAVALTVAVALSACTSAPSRDADVRTQSPSHVVATEPISSRATVREHALRRYGTAAEPLRVWVWGDSVAVTFQDVVDNALARLEERTGPSVLLRRSALGFGLTSDRHGMLDGAVTPPFFAGWPERLTVNLAHDRPDAVLLLVGTWDTLPRLVGGRWLAPGEPAWHDWYTRVVRATARRITATGAHLTLMTHPCVTNAVRNAGLPYVNAVYREVARDVPRVALVDIAAMACPDGKFDASIRSPEGTHFGADAPARLGPRVAAALATGWKLD